MERGQLHVDRPPGVFLRVVAGRESLREPPVQHLLLFPRRLRPRSTLHVARRPQLGAAGSHTHGTASSSPAAASSAEPGRQRPSSGSLPATAPVSWRSPDGSARLLRPDNDQAPAATSTEDVRRGQGQGRTGSERRRSAVEKYQSPEFEVMFQSEVLSF